MNNLFLYIICAHGILILGYLVYLWAYRRDHHFLFNRYYFLLLFGLAVLLPILPSPLSWSFDGSGAQQFFQTIQAANSSKPQDTVIHPNENSPSPKPDTFTRSSVLASSGMVFIWIYGIVTLVLIARLGLQLLSLWRLLNQYPKHRKKGHYLVYTDRESPAFSFFNRIVLNPKAYTAEQYDLIYQHELIHVRQRHHLDIILAELLPMYYGLIRLPGV